MDVLIQSPADMILQYEQLQSFAFSMDSEAAAVKIRLKIARKAAETGEQSKFESLVDEISVTLDEQFSKITAARNTALKVPSAALTCGKPV